MNITIAWIWGLRLSIRGKGLRYWVQYGNVKSNTTWNLRHALRWTCRIKSRISEEPIRVLSLTFSGDDRFYVMGYSPFDPNKAWKEVK